MVDIAALDDAEFAVVYALDQMFGVYGWHARGKPGSVSEAVLQALTSYGLYQEVGGETLPVQEAMLLLERRYHEWGSKSANDCKIRDARGDLDSLSDRSRYLLSLLATLTDECLKTPTGQLFHGFMGPGEVAMFQLKAYDLIAVDERSYGHWTERGFRWLQSPVYFGVGLK